MFIGTLWCFLYMVLMAIFLFFGSHLKFSEISATLSKICLKFETYAYANCWTVNILKMAFADILSFTGHLRFDAAILDFLPDLPQICNF